MKKKILATVIAVASLAACGQSQAAPSAPPATESAVAREIREANQRAETYHDRFMIGWRGYTADQKREFCWAVQDLGIAQSVQNAFEMERQNGGTVRDAEAARDGMRSFIREVC